jgi:steroid delta-isomerase-like uncharacterized protein
MPGAIIQADQPGEIVRRIVDEMWNRGDFAAGRDLFDPFLVHHNHASGGIDGIDAYERHVETFRGAFPDLSIITTGAVASGQRVVLNWVAQGTHSGPFLGLVPTGKPVSFTGVFMARIAFGRVAEWWSYPDTVTMLHQIGALPHAAHPAG